MSCSVCVATIQSGVLKRMGKDLEIEEKMLDKTNIFHCFADDKQEKKNVLLPMWYSLSKICPITEYKEASSSLSSVTIPLNSSSFDVLQNIVKKKHMSDQITFIGELNGKQSTVFPTIEKKLSVSRCVLCGFYTGFGKTILAIYIAHKLGYKTAVLCHRNVILQQWRQSIEKFLPLAKVHNLTSISEIGDCDFILSSSITATKRKRSDFKDVGLLIVDEAHAICGKVTSTSLFNFQPLYLIGLTATPYRKDGTDKILDLHFGFDNLLTWKMHQPFQVFKVKSGFTPITQLQKNGKMDWNALLSQQCEDERRNELIIDIVMKHFRPPIEEQKEFSELLKPTELYEGKNLLLFCKRVSHVNTLYDKLKKVMNDGEFDKFVSTQETFNKDAKILISTYSKAGVGFSHDKLNVLVLCSDVEDIAQPLGRVFRRQKEGNNDRIDSESPIIYDIVDNVPYGHPLMKHYRNRKKTYEEFGGIVVGEKRTPRKRQSDKKSYLGIQMG